MVVALEDRAHEAAVLDLEDVAQAVGLDLVRAEQPEVPPGSSPAIDVAKELAEPARGLVAPGSGLPDLERVGLEVGQVQVLEQSSPVGMGVGTHAPIALGRQGGE